MRARPERPRCAVLALSAGLLIGLPAAPSRADPMLDACLAKDDTNRGVSQCHAAFIARLQAQVDAAYAKLRARFPDEARMALEEDQRLWTAWKTKACDYYTDPSGFGREGAVFHFPACRERILKQRLEALRTAGDPYGVESR